MLYPRRVDAYAGLFNADRPTLNILFNCAHSVVQLTSAQPAALCSSSGPAGAHRGN